MTGRFSTSKKRGLLYIFSSDSFVNAWWSQYWELYATLMPACVLNWCSCIVFLLALYIFHVCHIEHSISQTQFVIFGFKDTCSNFLYLFLCRLIWNIVSPNIDYLLRGSLLLRIAQKQINFLSVRQSNHSFPAIWHGVPSWQIVNAGKDMWANESQGHPALWTWRGSYLDFKSVLEHIQYAITYWGIDRIWEREGGMGGIYWGSDSTLGMGGDVLG